MFQGKTLAKGHQTGKGSGKAAQSVEVAEVTEIIGGHVSSGIGGTWLLFQVRCCTSGKI